MCWTEPPLLHAPSSRCRTPQELWSFAEVWAPKSAGPCQHPRWPTMQNVDEKIHISRFCKIQAYFASQVLTSEYSRFYLSRFIPFLEKHIELGQGNFQKHYWKIAYFKNTWKTFHFSEIRHLGFWRKQRFQEKNKGKKCPTASKKWKWIHSSMQSYKVAPCTRTKLKMRTRLHVFFSKA